MQQSPNFKAFIESGDSIRVARLLSMQFLVQSISNAYGEEAVELMEKYDLVHRKIKTRINNLTVAFDLYDKELFQLIDTDGAKKRLLEDYEYFKSVCDKFMNLNETKGDNQ